MNRDIALYLGGKKVDWTKVPDILLNYQRTDYQNPTITKNMWSKTLTIEGTPNNNNIFNHIWNLERVMDDGFTLFNPSQRVSFELYNGAEIVEKGYAKLNSIKKDGYKIEYAINLFGGLGSFMYALAYDINTDKEKTLADLNYLGTSNPDDEFNFEINKNQVYDAWTALQNSNNTGSWKKWDYINFVPCYNGNPEAFDSDRVLINTHNLNGTKVRYTDTNGIVNNNFPMHISDGETTYGTVNGFVDGKMQRSCDEWEMRDLRSYLQRPALRVKGLLNAIKDPQNNGGYNVVLDRDFFSSGNPYYEKAWITLPMLNPETDAKDELIDWNWYKENQYLYTGDGPLELKWKLASSDSIVGTPDGFSMDVEIHATITGTSAQKLYTSCSYETTEFDPESGYDEWVTKYAYGGTAIQMYGIGNESLVWYRRSGKCGSPIIVLASKLNGDFIGRSTIRQYWNEPYAETDIIYNFGYWKKVSGTDYVWHNETDNTDIVHIQMDVNLMSEVPNVCMAFASMMAMEFGIAVGPNSNAGCAFDAQHYLAGQIGSHSFKYWNTIDFQNLDGNIIYKVNGKMRSFQPVTKKDLLAGMEGTPADWLLSYCKLFGLFIEKDKLTDTIYIKMRNNWYKNEVVDLEDLIDRSKDIKVTPLTFESKWYNFNYGEANSKFLDRYKNTYSQDFGKQLIDTKYNFDADEIDLLEDNNFRNGLTSLEKSNYFNTKYDINQNQIPQCLFDWCEVSYYKDDETYETNMCLPTTTTIAELNPNTPKEFYDALPKLQMMNEDKNPTDGDGVLVFFNGKKDTGNADYWISDDVDEMFIDSENPCWLQTKHEWNSLWTERIAIHTTTLPQFTRYMIYKNLITADWDFGYTKELYVPYYRFDSNRTPTMYQNFWQSYIQDLYSVNTRKVDCNVALNSNDINDFMKKFYWWDNSIWVCTQVKDYDIALEKSTLCSFTKVNNMSSYLEQPTFNDNFFNFYRNDGDYNIPAQGTDEERSFTFNLDCSTNWTVIDDGSGFASFDPNYPTTGSFGMGYTIKAKYLPNTSPSQRYALYSAFNEDGDARMIRVWQEGYVKEKYLTITPNVVILPKEVITPIDVVVDSSANWFCTTGNWAILDETYGDSGTTTLSLSATTNNTGSQRVLQILFNNADGLQAYLTVKQKGTDAVILEQNEITPVYTVPASGGNVHYKIINDVECEVLPQGNTANFAVASGLVTYNTTIQPSSGTNFWIHFDPNTSTVTRNASFYAYYVDANQGRHSIWPTIVQLPLTQLASGNTEVTYQSKSYTSATTLGASMKWIATTNNRWITILTPSGTSSDAEVEYTLDQNDGPYRTGYIYITYTDEMGYNCNETIVIHQEGIDTPWIVNPTGITVDDKGGDFIIGVTSQTPFSVSMSDDWVSEEISRDGMFTVHIYENYGYDRTMNIVVTADGSSKNVVVNQSGKFPSEYTLDYYPNAVFESSGGTIQLTIRSDSDWTITSGSTID